MSDVDQQIKATREASHQRSRGEKPDFINHPLNYGSAAKCECGRAIECIDVTEHMPFVEGNAVKYLWRADRKESKLDDLMKARWYINRAIDNAEKAAGIPKAPDEEQWDRGPQS